MKVDQVGRAYFIIGLMYVLKINNLILIGIGLL